MPAWAVKGKRQKRAHQPAVAQSQTEKRLVGFADWLGSTSGQKPSEVVFWGVAAQSAALEPGNQAACRVRPSDAQCNPAVSQSLSHVSLGRKPI